MAWQTTQPPDEEALLGAAPGAGIDQRLVPGEIREIARVVGVREDREIAVVLVMAVGVRWEVHVAGMGDRRVDLGMGGVRGRRTGEVLCVARALAIEAVPEGKADAGLDERLGPVTEIVEHLGLAALVAETHDDERPTNSRAQCLRVDEPLLEIAEPRPTPASGACLDDPRVPRQGRWLPIHR